mmetsp:Transcript_10883/g.12613  ORF Transcript_10883/g.12613 Transcript_10883/m.12613 type:complete len:136 (-) Transcript_10883:399-806(-)
MIGNKEACARWGCCCRSIERWQVSITPYVIIGGAEKNALTGNYQLLLVIGLFIYPNALADELATFIVANGGDVYSREQVSDRCEEINITRKRCSKEAYDTFSPGALEKLRWFKTCPPPLGVPYGGSLILTRLDFT